MSAGELKVDHSLATDARDDLQSFRQHLVYLFFKNIFPPIRSYSSVFVKLLIHSTISISYFVFVKLLIHSTISISYFVFVKLHLPFPINTLYLIQKRMPEGLSPKLDYSVKDEITSTTTRVIFTRSKHDDQPICLKLWLYANEKVCNNKLVTRKVDYLLEGLEFNRRFAPDVYLGIAPVNLSKDPKKIQRGKLIVNPDKTKLKPEVDYALVMGCLESNKRLDYQLYQGILGTQGGMKFLAKEVARMHSRLKKSPTKMGKPDSIASKLALNCDLFLEGLDVLASERLEKDDYITHYDWICDVMGQACSVYTKYFDQRNQEGKIRRCHGDLKTTNLWVRPKKASGGYELIALDCIDFNPDFCHIDILSDVAMLAIDLEMHLSESGRWINTYRGQKLSKYFLLNYLRAVQENSQTTWPLLEYYMTEKAMVCAYVSILYDKQGLDGEKYLDVALSHAQKLKKMLTHSDASRQTPSLLVSP
jgi:aminoglycoside phosphotransferase family enzyme